MFFFSSVACVGVSVVRFVVCSPVSRLALCALVCFRHCVLLYCLLRRAVGLCYAIICYFMRTCSVCRVVYCIILFSLCLCVNWDEFAIPLFSSLVVLSVFTVLRIMLALP